MSGFFTYTYVRFGRNGVFVVFIRSFIDYRRVVHTVKQIILYNLFSKDTDKAIPIFSKIICISASESILMLPWLA